MVVFCAGPKEKTLVRPARKIAHRFLLTIFCLTTVLVAACGKTSPGPTNPTKAPASQQVLISPESGISDIATFDPGLASDAGSLGAIALTFTGLVSLDDNLKVQPQLAASYTEGSDGLTWTFHLRPNLKFSDGTPLTSADVAYSIDRALQPAEKSTVGPIYLALIKDSDKLAAGQIRTIVGDSVMTPDPNTVIIVTNKKASYFLDALTYPCSYVVERGLIQKYGNTKWTDHLTEGGGDGPFKVLSYTHGQSIIFVPNPNYYGPHPQLRKIVVPFYKDADTTYKVYQAGQIDVTGIPSVNLAAARELTQEFHQVPQLWISYYSMNYLVKPFNNIKIRQAFELAINKDQIVHTVWRDSVIATNHIVPKGMPGYNPNLTGPDGVWGTSGDPVKAKALFQEGLQEEGLTLATLPPIVLTYASGSKDANNEVAALQQMWQNVLSVHVIASSIDGNSLLAEITAATNNPHGLQFWGSGWIADYPDPQDWTTLQFDKGVPNNNINYGQNNSSDVAQQQAVQQQLEAADVNPDPNTRLQQYMQSEQQLVNDVAWLPMEQVPTDFLRKPCVTGFTDIPNGQGSPNDWGRIYISTATPCADTSSFQ
jgi:oligopeptide transport system substrate-binding protein